MPKLLIAFILFLLASYFDKASKKKSKKAGEIKFDEIEYKDSEYGRMKEKIKRHAENGYSEFIDIMDDMDSDEIVTAKEKEYEKMQEELRLQLRKVEEFQEQLIKRERAIKKRELELDSLEAKEKTMSRNDIVNGVIFAEVLKRPKF